MVGTTRFELATSPTPILGLTQSEQFSAIYKLIGRISDPRLDPSWCIRDKRDTNGKQFGYSGSRLRLCSRGLRFKSEGGKR